MHCSPGPQSDELPQQPGIGGSVFFTHLPGALGAKHGAPQGQMKAPSQTWSAAQSSLDQHIPSAALSRHSPPSPSDPPPRQTWFGPHCASVSQQPGNGGSPVTHTPGWQSAVQTTLPLLGAHEQVEGLQPTLMAQ